MNPVDLSTLGIDRKLSARPRRHRRLWVWAIASVSVIAAAAAASAKYSGPLAVETVPVTTVYPSQAMTTLTATGYVVAQRKASVASKATGRLEWLGVAEGSQVKRGQVIARLESRDAAAAREQAAAGLEVARANLVQGTVELADAGHNFKRSQQLSAQKFISEAAHDGAIARFNKARASIMSLQASVAVASANLKAAEVALDQSVIRAPFDGVVLTKHANVGDNITPFSNAIDTKGAVVTIADMDTLEVEVDVSESSLAQARVGQHVEIQLDAVPDRRFPGVVDRMVPTIDRAKATVLMKVKFLERDEGVLPDMSAKVAFLGREPSDAERKLLTVAPASAIVERHGSKFVYVLSDGHARETAVEIGRAVGDLVEVRGVGVGERVVLKPLDRIADGVALKVAQQ
jgi:RND family efflux transporter MFP subunit